ncbi:MAG: threonine ammonia-lyase [Clostridiales bacterium]|nr:threonine ammonia-lyase [Clostridiales bacterium]
MKEHLDNIKKAQKILDGTIVRTPLIKSPFFRKETGQHVYLKPENLQTTGSFKIRGAYNKIATLNKQKNIKGIVAASAGNHAQGVSYACEKIGVPAIIVMPTITPVIKINATQSYGAEVILHGDVFDDAYDFAVDLAKRKGYDFIHPFDDDDVIYGQGTVGLEIMDELPDVDMILVPVGGGGLIAGIALAVKSINPNVKVIGVEPEGAMAMLKSMDAGEIMSIDEIKTLAEGVAVQKPGNIPFEIVKEYVDDIITVNEEDISEAVLLLMEQDKIVAEAAGALSLAALKQIDEQDKKIVCLVSGGNMDVVTISSAINKGLISRGRILGIAVDLPDKPGQLMKVSQILATEGGNVIQLDHNQFKSNNRYTNVRLEITLETSGHDHIKRVISALEGEGFILHRIF